jgi:hypothetical protein
MLVEKFDNDFLRFSRRDGKQGSDISSGETSQRLPGDLVDPAQTASSMRADLVALGVRVGWVSGRQGE